MTKTVAIIQARHTSTRLPGKCILPLVGKPVIAHITDRLKAVPEIDQICVAMPEGDAQDPLARVVEDLSNIHLTKGPEDDLLSRYAMAADQTDAEIILQCYADSPAIDPAAISQLLSLHTDTKAACSIIGVDSGYPWGYECYAINREALMISEREVTDLGDRENITSYIFSHPGEFLITRVYRPGRQQSNYEVLLDTYEDYQRLEKIFYRLYPNSPSFGVDEIDNLYLSNPELFKIKI